MNGPELPQIRACCGREEWWAVGGPPHAPSPAGSLVINAAERVMILSQDSFWYN